MSSNFMDLIFNGEYEKVAELLINNKDLSTVRYDGKSSLYWACLLENCNIVKLLLLYGSNPNDTDIDGESPLHVATFNGNICCVDKLISNGADVDQATNEGITPLMMAAKGGNIEVVKKLLDAGANYNALDLAGRNVFHWSATGEHDDPDLIALLLEAGANPLIKNINGQSPLEYSKALNKVNIYNSLKNK